MADHRLDARQTRLWVSLRNGVHHSAFSGPWLRQHLVDLIEEHVGAMDIDTSNLMQTLQGLSDPTQLQEMMSDASGLTGFLTSPESPSRAQEQARAAIGFVSGYADYVLDNAAAKLLPDLAAIRAAHQIRRSEPGTADQLLTRILGLELTEELNALGTTFCTEVDRRWGTEALQGIWSDPEQLPRGEELADPVAWAARVLLPQF